jgi:hypothetical protein
MFTITYSNACGSSTIPTFLTMKTLSCVIIVQSLDLDLKENSNLGPILEFSQSL